MKTAIATKKRSWILLIDASLMRCAYNLVRNSNYYVATPHFL